MAEEYWAERFSRDVDGLTNAADRLAQTNVPTDYREALKFARDLARWDFSVESRRRESLRRQLILQAQQDAAIRQERQMNTLRLRRTLVLTIIGAALALALMLTLFYPGGMAAAADNLYNAIRTILLGDYSRAVQVPPGTGDNSAALPPDVWKISTEIGNFAGNAPPGVEPIVRSMTSLNDAQAVAKFHLAAPTDLPRGYVLREVKLAPIGGTHWVISFYGGSAHDVIVVQMPVGRQPSQNPNELTGIFSGFGTDGTLAKTDLDGRPAAWADGHSLMWEAGGISYVVGGLDLTLDEAKQIARSLR